MRNDQDGAERVFGRCSWFYLRTGLFVIDMIEAKNVEVARRTAPEDFTCVNEAATAEVCIECDLRANPGTGLAIEASKLHRAFVKHVERPERITAIETELHAQGLAARCTSIRPRKATAEELLHVLSEETPPRRWVG